LRTTFRPNPFMLSTYYLHIYLTYLKVFLDP
jgi:hypothetical protein